MKNRVDILIHEIIDKDTINFDDQDLMVIRYSYVRKKLFGRGYTKVGDYAGFMNLTLEWADDGSLGLVNQVHGWCQVYDDNFRCMRISTQSAAKILMSASRHESLDTNVSGYINSLTRELVQSVIN